MKEESINYEELEGKIVTYDFGWGRENLLVVGCDRDIGITLCLADDKEDNRICINGPLSPISKENNVGWKTEKAHLKVYYAMFDYLVKAIKKGAIYSDKLLEVKANAANMDQLGMVCTVHCAFTQ